MKFRTCENLRNQEIRLLKTALQLQAWQVVYNLFSQLFYLEHVFVTSRRLCSVHKSGDFLNPIEAIARDLLQTTNLVIKQSWCIQLTIVADLNLWIDILKSQIGDFVCNSLKVEESMDLKLQVVKQVIITTRGRSKFRVKSII